MQILHEQTLLKLNDTAWYSDLQEVEKRSDLSPQEELQAAKNRSFWSTIRNEESSGDLLTKRLTAKASLGVGSRPVSYTHLTLPTKRIV